MEVVCSNCQARLKIPDEKVPETGRVTANCPKCKNKISFETVQSTYENFRARCTEDKKKKKSTKKKKTNKK